MAVVVLRHESEALRDNPLGDPHVRNLHCVVPEDLDALGSDQAIPVLWYLSGYAGVSRGMLSDSPWEEGLDERMIRLRAEGKIGPMIIALPDCFTKYGGSQTLSSSAHGDYETYLLKELRHVVETKWKISGHAIAGKSSGGFGAIVHGMRNPGLFDAVACHSGDMGFRLAHASDLPLLMNALHQHGGVEAFVAAFDQETKKKTGRWIGPMSMLAYAAAYSPDPACPLGIAMPFNLQTGQIDDSIFARWMEWDPVEMIDQTQHRDALAKLKCLFVDCGARDEYHLQWGARGFVKKLTDYGIAHEYEEFPDGHRSTSYRLDVSIPKIYKALT